MEKIIYALYVLGAPILGGIYWLWKKNRLHDLPDTILVLSIALIPAIIALMATYFAAKHKNKTTLKRIEK